MSKEKLLSVAVVLNVLGSNQGKIIAAVTIVFASVVLARYYYQKKNTDPIDKSLSLVANAFKNGKPLTGSPPIEFVGRIQYEPYNGYLTKTVRPYAFVSGEDGIYEMSKEKTDNDKCLFVGMEINWMKSQCNKGRKFRLILFPKAINEHKAIWMTWDNTFNLLKEKYNNNIYPRIKPFMNDLKTKTFQEITRDADFNFAEVEENGISDPNYMTFEKFVNIPKQQVTLIDVRLFLFCWLHLNELFDGDGYTQDENGKRGCKEYLFPNIKLDDIPHLHIVPLNIQV
eukprot:338525_1